MERVCDKISWKSVTVLSLLYVMCSIADIGLYTFNLSHPPRSEIGMVCWIDELQSYDILQVSVSNIDVAE